MLAPNPPPPAAGVPLARVRALLFDLDGVLVDSRVPIARSLNFALERLGVGPRPEAELHRWIGPPLVEGLRALLAAHGGDPARAEEGVALYRERYRDACLVETEAVAGMAGALVALGRERPLAVATSKPEAFARPILEALGLAGHFAAVVGPGLQPEAEPKSETVGRALAALGLAAAGGDGPRAALVGDRLHDVVAGRAHGLHTVGVTWGIGSERELREAGADHLVADPGALAALLAEL